VSSPAKRPFRPFRSLAVTRGLALALVATTAAGALAAACSNAPEPPQTAAVPGRTVDPAAPWSRADFGARPAEVKNTGPASVATVDPYALDDLLRQVPKDAPAPTDPDGGTRVGSDTGEVASASPVTTFEPPQRTKKGTVQLGVVAVQTDMASPAIEREARAQLYFPLVTRCRDKSGKILPPDAILLDFTIDIDGYIVPQNIAATATDPAHKAAADCMRRELSGLPFRGPPGARGQSAQVKMTVPSVD